MVDHHSVNCWVIWWSWTAMSKGDHLELTWSNCHLWCLFVSRGNARYCGWEHAWVSQEKELGGVGWYKRCGGLLDVGVGKRRARWGDVILNSQTFDQRVICLERRIEINFDLNLIIKLRSLQTVRPFLKFVLAIFPAKSCRQFHSYRPAVIVVEGFHCGCANRSLPIVQTFGEPNDDNPEGGAGYLHAYTAH